MIFYLRLIRIRYVKYYMDMWFNFFIRGEMDSLGSLKLIRDIILGFLSLISQILSLMQTTKEVNPDVSTCELSPSYFYFYSSSYDICLLSKMTTLSPHGGRVVEGFDWVVDTLHYQKI